MEVVSLVLILVVILIVIGGGVIVAQVAGIPFAVGAGWVFWTVILLFLLAVLVVYIRHKFGDSRRRRRGHNAQDPPSQS